MSTTTISPTSKINHPYIERKPGVCGGKPVIVGTRIKVTQVAIGYERLGMTPAEIVADYPHLSTVQIADALAYYEDHREEVEAEFTEEERYLNVELPHVMTNNLRNLAELSGR
jgi:uncharacterized protein (DUF433 family)